MKLRIKRLSWLTILISMNCAMFAMSLVVAGRLYLYEAPRQTLLDTMLNRTTEPQLIDYKDFISIMLTGLSAMVTVLGIGLATIAIWGFSQIKEEARRAAEAIAREESTRIAVQMNRERQSAEEARGFAAKGASVPAPTVQNLVDALTGDEEPSGQGR